MFIYLTIGRLARLGLMFTTVLAFSSSANQALLEKADMALVVQNYELAAELYTQLQRTDGYTNEALLGLAKAYLFTDKLNTAEKHINHLLEISADDPEYYYIAARVSAKKAQKVNYFSKIGYAKQTKAYFEKALALNQNHTPSIIGLIGFHQQAPIIAGSDKASIPELIHYLWKLDAKQAFLFEIPNTLKNASIDEVWALYDKAVNADSTVEQGRFHYDFAMILSNNGLYKAALEQLLTIDMQTYQEVPPFYHMRFYQIAKTAAEANSQLDIGLENIRIYKAFAEEKRAISVDWVGFREAQLRFLIDSSKPNTAALAALARRTNDKDLTEKINAVLQTQKLQVNMP